LLLLHSSLDNKFALSVITLRRWLAEVGEQMEEAGEW